MNTSARSRNSAIKTNVKTGVKIKENTPYLSMMYCNLINFFPIEYIVHVFGKNNNIVE